MVTGGVWPASALATAVRMGFAAVDPVTYTGLASVVQSTTAAAAGPASDRTPTTATSGGPDRRPSVVGSLALAGLRGGASASWDSASLNDSLLRTRVKA